MWLKAKVAFAIKHYSICLHLHELWKFTVNVKKAASQHATNCD